MTTFFLTRLLFFDRASPDAASTDVPTPNESEPWILARDAGGAAVGILAKLGTYVHAVPEEQLKEASRGQGAGYETAWPSRKEHEVLLEAYDIVAPLWKVVQRLAYGMQVSVVEWHTAICHLLYDHVRVVFKLYAILEVELQQEVLSLVHALCLCAAECSVMRDAKSRCAQVPFHLQEHPGVGRGETSHVW